MPSIEQIVALRYNDMKALRKELERIFPGEKWKVDTEMGQYHLTIPRMLTKEEIALIDSKQRHYRRRSERRR
ncbi:hypothetical protein OIDMADRAFT_175460 [Oidiodendron maius Zn]|uniref:Uncharacterized protein n=1 Tax=Oidiodendron maius (strain Zn) TaxID=913774 RepID=A0A0C3HKG1_OIDMZ|nr:hypothetical protein OIDMADRAFT_175460 [Oidiodendron maius Zn]